MTGAASAQQPLIALEAAADSSILDQWLHSGDPRLIAWAADFARRTHDTKVVAEMPPLLEHWAIPQAGDGDSQAALRRAVTAVLDTLIQENVQVPISGIAAAAELFPVLSGHPDWPPSLVRIACNSRGLDLRRDWNLDRTHARAHRIHDAGEGSGTESRNLEPAGC